MPSWTAILHPNPSDPHPVVFAFDSTTPAPLSCSDDSMLDAVHHLAARLPSVSATPTGPFAPPDPTVAHLAFQLVFDLALLAGLDPEEIEVEGDGWQWPARTTPGAAEDGIVY